MPRHLESRADLLRAIADRADDAPRRLVAIAGPPGAGKSTLAAWLADALNRRRPGAAAVLGMDAFHFDDVVLAKKGWLGRKGAPHTFDVGGLCAMLDRLRRNREPSVAVPVFDRSLELSRAGACLIAENVETILVEGNYLLCRDAPWAMLAGCFDIAVMLEVDRAALEQRLTRRWLDLGMSTSEARRRVETNDLLNVDFVIKTSGRADFVLRETAAEPPAPAKDG